MYWLLKKSVCPVLGSPTWPRGIESVLFPDGREGRERLMNVRPFPFLNVPVIFLDHAGSIVSVYTNAPPIPRALFGSLLTFSTNLRNPLLRPTGLVGH